MPPGAETVWHWEFDPWVLALILLPGVLYVGGWRQVHRQMPHRFGAARLAAFLAGLAALFIAIAAAPCWRAVPATAARAAAACGQTPAGALPRLAGAGALGPLAHASPDGLARLCRHQHGLACARLV